METTGRQTFQTVDKPSVAGLQLNENKGEENLKSKFKAAAFLFGVSGISIVSGFGYAIGTARKSDPQMFDKGMLRTKNLHTAGSSLALKALGWGTLYAVGGFTLFCTLVWKLSGAKDIQEFRAKAGSVLPKIPKNDPPQGRTEFENLTDLLQYVIDEDDRLKKIEEKDAGIEVRRD